jgi:hypothetical protein
MIINYIKNIFSIEVLKYRLKNNVNFIIGKYRDTGIYLFCLAFRKALNGRNYVEYKEFRIFDNLTERQLKRVIDLISKKAKKKPYNGDPFAYLDELVELMDVADSKGKEVFQRYRGLLFDFESDDLAAIKAFERKARKISKDKFIERYKILRRNNEYGVLFEELFEEVKGGTSQVFIELLDGRKRFIDNIIKIDGVTIARELKSGRITLSKFKKQIIKDLEILQKRHKSIDAEEFDQVNKIEWHTLEGVDHRVLDFILDELKKRKLPRDSFRVVAYD